MLYLIGVTVSLITLFWECCSVVFFEHAFLKVCIYVMLILT